ncbi:E3 ubiquitin-protein ligase RNF43 [Symbiodinium microadriaticum]|uniref:E3 ubiquitin-protein ligase RNF43 n=2 Tax=Symbiodinium TaxID=2949 RepID=A0A1Q9CWT6_SYMMI|nr:E3 ubiquitin-protein ligase RNF43 [Symbiodinium microadriaticum]
MGREFRPQPFHVLAGPGLRTGERLAVEFDAAILDLVAPVSKIQAESVVEFELPSLFDQRPHEDATVEAWLQKYLDSGGRDGEIVLEAKCCAKLQLAIEEQPEVCPVFRHLMSQFEVALVAWLEEWPPAEPHRQGLCLSSGEISPELLELQLHSVLALLGEGGLLAALSEHQAVVDGFRSVAIAWIFKLHSLYGLEILSQHERVTAKSASHLSMLSWELFQVEELLQSPFFRPQEMSLWRFAKRWCVEGAGAPAFTEESEDAEGKVEVLPSPNKDEIDGAFSKVLLWDLLPPNEELVVQFAAAQAAAPAVEGEQTPENSQHGASKGPTELSTGDPEAEEFQEPVEKSKASRPRRVDGSTFVRAERRADCALKPFEDADALHLSYADDSTSLHCWNSAQELQVLGGSRQVLVSTVPMTSGGGGRFRFDFRLSSGSGADAAPLFEYMRRSSPQWDLAAMAAEGAPRWRDRGSGPRAPLAPRLPWRGRTREAAEHHGTHSHDPWDPWSIAAGRNPWSSGDFGDPWNGWATLDSENPWEDSWDGFAVHSSDTRPFFFAPLNEPLNVPPPSVPVHSREPGQLGPWRATSSGSQPGTGVNVRNLPRHDVPMPAPRIAFTEATRQDMGQSSLETTWMGSLRTEEPVILPPRAPPPSIPPPRPPYFEMSQVVFHRGDGFGHGRDRDSFVSGPPPGAPIPGPVPPIPPGLVFPGGVGLGVGVTVWDIGSVASLSSTRSLARGVIEAHTALYTFKQKDVRGEACDSASKKCCICLEDFVEGQQLRILPCFHRYHQCCIDEWLCRSDECPLCKFRITADDTALMDSIEVSSHGSATPRSPPLATIESGSEATEESVQGRDRFWSHAVGVNDAIHDDDFLNAGAWPPLRDERQAGSPSPAFIERTWDRFGGINTQVSNLTAAIQVEMHEAPGAHQVPEPFQEAPEPGEEPVPSGDLASVPRGEEPPDLRPRAEQVGTQDYILEVWERYQDAEGRHWFFCPRNNDWFYTDEAETSCWYQFCDPNTPETLWWWNSLTNRAFFEP